MFYFLLPGAEAIRSRFYGKNCTRVFASFRQAAQVTENQRKILREAAKLGVKSFAFAPLIRDQGNAKLPAGDVEILAYDTVRRMQKEGLARAFTLEEWIVEAGPFYFDETVSAAQTAINDAKGAAAKRKGEPYGKPK